MNQDVVRELTTSVGAQNLTVRLGIPGVVELAVARYREPLMLADLASAAGMPSNSLTRLFNRRLGLSPMRWLWCLRVTLAAEMIAADPGASLTLIAGHCGFASIAHFSRRFRDQFGESPSQFRAGMRGKDQENGGGPAELIGRAVARLVHEGAKPV